MILSYPELQTLLAKITYTVNSRPLGLACTSGSSQQDDTLMPITPNMMLLGRSSSISPPLVYSEDERFCSRLAYIGQVEGEWWQRWIKLVLPTLLSFKKWKTKKQNIAPGELVLLQYPKQFKDDYCLARVCAAPTGSDGLVRKVVVEYRKKNPRESPETYASKPLIKEEVMIHRLHRLDIVDQEYVDKKKEEDVTDVKE